jgi:hypothetical protein
MADQNGPDDDSSAKAAIEQLERSGFFQQMGGLESNLRTLAESLKTLGDSTVERMKEVESLVAHVIAIEAVLAVLVRTHPIDPQAVRTVVKQRTGDVSADGEGSPAVLGIVENIVGK